MSVQEQFPDHDPGVIGELVEALRPFAINLSPKQYGPNSYGEPFRAYFTVGQIMQARAALAKYATQQGGGRVVALMAALADLIDVANSFCDDGDTLAGEIRVRVKRMIAATQQGDQGADAKTAGSRATLDRIADLIDAGQYDEAKALTAGLRQALNAQQPPVSTPKSVACDPWRVVLAEVERALSEGVSPDVILAACAPVSTETRGEGDWIEWPGGEHPAPGLSGRVRFRDGSEEDFGPRQTWSWLHFGRHPKDIIAYSIEGEGT